MYKRIKFGDELDFIKPDNGICECCGECVGHYHAFGCRFELSPCFKHPGRAIDCACDEQLNV